MLSPPQYQSHLGVSPPHSLTAQPPIPASGQSYVQPVPEDPVSFFFESLKRSLADPEAYDEFLNVLQMYTMEILDARALLDRLEPFLTEEEMEQFVELLGWEDEQEKTPVDAERDPPSRRRALRVLSTTAPRQLVVTHIGPSYRSTPLSVSAYQIADNHISYSASIGSWFVLFGERSTMSLGLK